MNVRPSSLPPSTVKAVEGQYRDGPWLVDAGVISASWGKNLNWWQNGHSPVPYSNGSAMVRACISAYAETVAMCPGGHWWTNPDGGRELVKNSALSRILRSPNGYSSISDFMLNAVWNLYDEGNIYALGLRNDRFEISEIHLMNPGKSGARVATTGEVFYSLGGNEIIERRLAASGSDADLLNAVPARDVLHVRLHTPHHPLKGVSPLVAAALDVAAGNAMLQQQIAFYLNQARPSQALGTDQVLTKEQTDQLRERWNEQSQGLNAGGTPILTAGLKPLNLAGSAQDAQLAEMMKMTEQHIALSYRVPLQILGIGGTPFASTEILMQSWVASGLGFALNHIEEAFGQWFRLKGLPDEYIEFDTSALLRSAFKDRVEAFARSVQGGIHAPDEARAEFELAAAPGGFGKEPRVQQQVVPLSAAGAIPSAPPAPGAPAAVPALPVDPEPDSDLDKAMNHNEHLRRSFRAAHARHVTV